MYTLNYHHLRYFHAVAHHGQLSHAAEILNVSQSALSMQIKQLEERLGHALFDRVGRRLVLTEAGKIALDHADRIFSEGADLLAILNQAQAEGRPLRVGALSTLSRNFQLQFLRPLLASGSTPIVLKSGNTRSLLEALNALELDVVLTTQIPENTPSTSFAAQKITEQTVGLHGQPRFLAGDTLADLIATAPIILPTDAVIGSGFETLIARLGVTPHIAASVDDMAMVRLLAREGAGLAVAPAVVFADEIAAGILHTAPFETGISEPFFAVTRQRQFAHPALSQLL